MTKIFEIELGTKVKDVVSGFEGIIVGRSNWLTGCNTYGLQAKAEKGSIPEVTWVDENRLEVIKENVIKLPESAIEGPPGGPQPTPKQMSSIGK